MARFQHRKLVQRLPSTPLTFNSLDDVHRWAIVLTRTLTGVDDEPVLSARVTHSVAQSIANNTFPKLVFDTARWNDGGLWDSTANTKLTAPVSGLYVIGAHIEWEPNAAGIRVLELVQSSVSVIASIWQSAAVNGPTRQSIATLWYLAVNDFVEVQVSQDSGGPLLVPASSKYSPEFWMQWLSPLQE
jgi:hypothetical protein